MPHNQSNLSLAEEWLKRAKSNLALAKQPKSEEIFFEDLCFETQQASEKALKENGEKIPADKKTELEGAIAEAKTKLASESLDEIKAATERLQNVAHSLAQFMYQGTGGAEAGAGAGPQGQQAQGESAKKDDGDDVVDADYKEV